jgi:hypothetical protein
MAFDSTEARMGGRSSFTPMQIAHHTLFTAKEKLDLLNKIKAEVTGAVQNEDDLGFSPEEVDEAIAEVRLGAQNGEQTRTVIWGDN